MSEGPSIYAKARLLADEVRTRHGVTGPRLGLRKLKAICKAEGVKVEYRSGLKKLRGAYLNDSIGATALVSRDLPLDPKVFTLAHELKHHLCDSEACIGGTTAEAEIAAEVFAAELLFPVRLFIEELTHRGITYGTMANEDALKKAIIDIKRDTKTTLSYQGIAKRAELLGYAGKSSLAKVKWVVLERSIYGLPAYLSRRRTPVA